MGAGENRGRNKNLETPSNYKGRFPFVRSNRPKKTGSGQFKWKGPRRARVHFSRHNSQIPALWPTGAGELSGFDP